MRRCDWAGEDPLYVEYHDHEWGTPVHDDRLHFEFLLLEFFQAGLSWMTILRKRESFRAAFDGFDPDKISRYGESETRRLLSDRGIVRNRLKIKAAVTNACRFLEVREEFGGFDAYIWHFTAGRPIVNRRRSMSEIPVSTPLSDRVSADMKKRGFVFVGTTTTYAHLQAIGIVNDHLVDCFRWKELAGGPQAG